MVAFLNINSYHESNMHPQHGVNIFLFFIFSFFDKGSSPRPLDVTGFSCRILRRKQIYLHKVKLSKIDRNVYNV